MTVTHGQRRDVVLQISEALRREAAMLEEITQTAGRSVDGLRVAWLGPDLDRYAGQWDAQLPTLHDAVHDLREMSTRLREQAREQEEASGGTGLGGTGGPGGGPGPSTPPGPGGGEHTGIGDTLGGTEPQRDDKDLWKLAWHAYGPDNERYGQPPDFLEQPPLPPGWSEVTPEEIRALGLDPADFADGGSGFASALYRREDGSYVLAYRGSDNGPDWPNNFAQGLGITGDIGETIGAGLPVVAGLAGSLLGPLGAVAGIDLGQRLGGAVTDGTSQYEQAMDLAARVDGAVGPGNLAFTGHSLGRGLAAAASMATGEPAVTFDAAGVHPDTAAYAASLRGDGATAQSVMAEANGSDIRAYRISDDILTSVQEQGGLAPLAPDAPGTHIDLAPVDDSMRRGWQSGAAGEGARWGAVLAPLTGLGLPVVPTVTGLGSLLTGQGVGESLGDTFSAFVNPVGEGAELGSSVAGQAYGHHWTPMDRRMEQLFPR